MYFVLYILCGNSYKGSSLYCTLCSMYSFTYVVCICVNFQSVDEENELTNI